MFYAILSAQKKFSPKIFLGEARHDTMLPSISSFLTWFQVFVKQVSSWLTQTANQAHHDYCAPLTRITGSRGSKSFVVCIQTPVYHLRCQPLGSCNTISFIRMPGGDRDVSFSGEGHVSTQDCRVWQQWVSNTFLNGLGKTSKVNRKNQFHFFTTKSDQTRVFCLCHFTFQWQRENPMSIQIGKIPSPDLSLVHWRRQQ